MNGRLPFLPLLILAVLACDLFAFSAGGHRIIASIAWQRMPPESRAEAVRLIRQHPRLKPDFLDKMPDSVRSGPTRLQDEWLFYEAAVWPDTARGLPRGERGKYNRGHWHYVNFPIYLDESDVAVIDLSRVNRDTEVSGWSDNPEFNIIQAIKANLAGLHSDERTDAEKAVHLCWVLHLVGDAHQPLHSSALFSKTTFPNGDRGGNLIKIGSSNLHSLWDRLLPNEKTVGAVRGRAVKLVDAADANLIAESSQQLNPLTWIM